MLLYKVRKSAPGVSRGCCDEPVILKGEERGLSASPAAFARLRPGDSCLQKSKECGHHNDAGDVLSVPGCGTWTGEAGHARTTADPHQPLFSESSFLKAYVRYSIHDQGPFFVQKCAA